MLRARVIPCLLLSGQGLVKTRRFRDPVYLGDPINAARIFSEKEVDELVLLDIAASRQRREPDYELVAEVAGECFMPLSYGGGVRRLDQVRRLIRCGVEKLVLNTVACESRDLVRAAAGEFGSQAVVGGIDVAGSKADGWRVMTDGGRRDTGLDLDAHVQGLVQAGVGELFINHVDRDGGGQGYDLELIRHISAQVRVPVVACGGAGSVADLRAVVEQAGASAAAAGSLFVFYGRHRAVLINMPNAAELDWG